MPYESAIDLVDRDYGVSEAPKNLRSIRFKSKTFQTISNVWKNFRIKKLTKKIEKKVDDFKNMEFSSRDIKATTGDESKAAKKVMKKAVAIAKLEEKLNILYDIPVSPSFVEDRAIKLKDNMMKSLRFNSDSVYSVPDEMKEDLFTTTGTDDSSKGEENETKKDVDKVLEDEEEKRSEEVKEMMGESNDENIRDDVVIVPERDVKEAVDKEFTKQEEAYNAQQEDVNNNSDESSLENNTEDNAEDNIEIDREAIKKAVDDAINDVKISKNSARAAKVEKYVNPKDGTYVRDDGTYLLSRDDIDEDFRITRIDGGVKVNIPKIKPEDVFKTVRSDDNLKDAVASEEVIDEKETVDDSEEVIDEEKDVVAPEEVNEVANDEEATHFNYDEDSVKTLTEAIDRAESKDDIQSILERVKKLKERQNETKKLAMEAKERRQESEKMKVDALERLRAYEDALKDDLGFNQRVAEEDLKKAQSNEDLVDMMLSMIQPEADPSSIRVEKGK